MAQLQKRKTEGEVGADATTPKGGEKQRRICNMQALKKIETTPENLQSVRDMVNQQLEKSSQEKVDCACSEKDWWLVASVYLTRENIGDKRFLTILQESESSALIAFNAYRCNNQK